MTIKPLEGKCVVVTRPRAQASALSALLRERGALAIEWPLIEIVPPADVAPLAAVTERLAEFDWVVFTSANGVEQFLRYARTPVRFPKIAAVGPRTAAALNERGYRANVVPAEFLSDALPAALGELANKKVLLVRPEGATTDLARLLQARGASVEEVVAYRTLPTAEDKPFLWREVDVLTLASGSAAQGLIAHVREWPLPGHVCVASIGPSTTRVAEKAGLHVAIEAAVHTSEGLVAALAMHFASSEGRP